MLKPYCGRRRGPSIKNNSDFVLIASTESFREDNLRKGNQGIMGRFADSGKQPVFGDIVSVDDVL